MRLLALCLASLLLSATLIPNTADGHGGSGHRDDRGAARDHLHGHDDAHRRGCADGHQDRRDDIDHPR